MLITQPLYSWPFYVNKIKNCGDNDIQKSNDNLFGQVAVLNCQKTSEWFWKAPEIYQLRFYKCRISNSKHYGLNMK